MANHLGLLFPQVPKILSPKILNVQLYTSLIAKVVMIICTLCSLVINTNRNLISRIKERCIHSMFNVSMLLAPKLDQLIWAAAWGRRNDEMIRLWVHSGYYQFLSVGSFYLPQHRTLSTRQPLALYVTCNWQACWDFAAEGHVKVFVSPSRGLNFRTASEWLNN